MKLLNIFKQQLTEAKQAGVLYYFDSLKNLSVLMKSGIEFQKVGDQYRIITSREGSAYSSGYKSFMLKKDDVRIALDGNKISENYSVSPSNKRNIVDKAGTNMLAFKKFKADAISRFERLAKENPSIKDKVKSEPDILKYYGDTDLFNYQGYIPRFDTKEGGMAQENILSLKPGYLSPKYFLRIDIRLAKDADKYYREDIMKIIDKIKSENPGFNVNIVTDFK